MRRGWTWAVAKLLGGPCRRIAPQCRVRQFDNLTPDLVAARPTGLAACHVDHVAMEATGVYWIPVFSTWALPG